MTARLVEKVHRLLQDHLQPGDHAIDATAGNGHDTVALANLVGAGGHILAIDLQEAALKETHARLEENSLAGQVELRPGCHATILASLAKEMPATINAIVFNLGYLPGSDHTVRTAETTTIAALDAAARLLQPGGLLTLMAYRGHPGGLNEAAAVEQWMQASGASGLQATREVTGPKESVSTPVLWTARKSGH